ncbi:unnamed protein product, partial [Ectocarpus fasciculatus]
RATATGSQGASLWCSRPWPRSSRPTPRCTCCASAFGRDCSFTAPSPPSRTCRARTTGSSSPTRSSGSWTTATCTESPST